LSSAGPDLEVVVLGRSKGESVVVRMGDDLLVVDSFLAGKRPAAHAFIEQARWKADRVLGIVATHWDDDHVHGLAAVLADAPAARFFAPAVSDSVKLAAWLAHTRRHRAEADDPADATGSFARVLTVLKERDADGHRVKARAMILRHPESGCLVLGLSPTQRAIDEERATALGGTGTVVASNLTSIALWIQTDTHRVLLGGDLESHPDFGWDAAIGETADLIDDAATLVKVPHHGSADAHADAMWSTLLKPKPWAVLTPYGPVLPRVTDMARLYGLASELHVAAGPRWPGWEALGLAVGLSTAGTVRGARRPGYVRYTAAPGGGWDVARGAL
jgi:hypothetical protein